MYKHGTYKYKDVRQELRDRLSYIQNMYFNGKTLEENKKQYFDYFGYPDELTFNKYNKHG